MGVAIAGSHQPSLLPPMARDWILATSAPHGFWCRRCDARLTYDGPVHTHRYLDDARWFQAAHEGCRL